MKKNRKRRSRFKLTVIFTLTVFLIISVTMFLVTIAEKLIRALPFFAEHRIPAYMDSVVFTVLTLIVGTLLSFVFSSIVISPMDRLLDALEKIVLGDYSVRVEPKGIRVTRRLGRRFNHMAEELESVEMLRRDFVNNFSHEFKTPITSLHGFAKLLKSDDLTDEKREAYLDVIISESERLAGLANNALLYSKIDNWTSLGEVNEFNLCEQVRAAVVLLESKWSAKNLSVGFDGGDYTVCASSELLAHVWINLIDNAIKFSPEGSEIQITAQKEINGVTVSVTDHGIGMDDEIVSNIFDKFYQGDKSHSTVGNGLGLAIAKKIIDLHDGTITIESRPEHGTTAKVFVPFAQKIG